MIADHLARYRIDCRLADAQHQSWPGDRANTATGSEANTWLDQQTHLAKKQCTVGHVWIVPGILDRPGLCAVIDQAAELQAHLHLLAFGQDDLHGVRASTAEQQASRRQAGRGGAAAGGQSAAQRGRLFGGFVTHRKASSHPAR
ncbi:hypothetical protein D3C76_1407930 [compost metagenome]